MFTRSSSLLIVFAVVGFLANVVTSQESGFDDGTIYETRTIRIVDEDESPIEGATVCPYAFRLHAGNGHYGWERNERLKPPQITRSNEEGEVQVTYPAIFGKGKLHSDGIIHRLQQLSISVSHPKHIGEEFHLDLPLEGQSVKLKKGATVTVSICDAEFEALPYKPIVIGTNTELYNSQDAWREITPGLIVSSAFATGNQQILAACVDDKDNLLFADIFFKRVDVNEEVDLRDTPVEPGYRVQGRLSDIVPRPVRNGIVVLSSVPLPTHTAYVDVHNPCIVWNDFALVAADGTFDFPSVPRGGELQLITVCDGWYGENRIEVDADREDKKPMQRYEHYGLVRALESDINIELPMLQSLDLEVYVRAAEGEAMEGVAVAVGPNQFNMARGANFLGTGMSSGAFLKKIAQGETITSYTDGVNDNFAKGFRGTTDASGFVLLKNVSRLQNRIHLEHPGFEFKGERVSDFEPKEIGDGRYRITIELQKSDD